MDVSNVSFLTSGCREKENNSTRPPTPRLGPVRWGGGGRGARFCKRAFFCCLIHVELYHDDKQAENHDDFDRARGNPNPNIRRRFRSSAGGHSSRKGASVGRIGLKGSQEVVSRSW